MQTATAPWAPAPEAKKKRRVWPWIVGGLVVMTIVFGGCAAMLSAASTAAEDGSIGDGLVPDKAEHMTMAEFNQIKAGQPLAQVQQIVGSPGEIMSENEILGSLAQTYEWSGDSLGSVSLIHFTDGVVSSKTQSGLR